MKIVKLLVLFVALLMSCYSILPVTENKKGEIRLLSAYKFVQKKYKGEIVVSDTIVKIDIANFSDEISSNKQIGLTKLLDSLLKIDNDFKYSKYKYPVKKILNNNNKKGNFKFYFSKPTLDYLMVEVFETNRSNNNYDELTFFGSSDIYLLYFNEDNQIIENYKITLDYN